MSHFALIATHEYLSRRSYIYRGAKPRRGFDCQARDHMHYISYLCVIIQDMERNEIKSQSFEAQATWQLDSETPVNAANQFMVQSGSETNAAGEVQNFYLRVGHASPPMLMEAPKPNEKIQIPVGVLGSYFVTREEVRKLRNLLNQVLGE